MSQYRKILLIADPTLPTTPAFQRAVALATATGAELHLCVFDYSSAIAAVAVVSEKVSELAKWGFVEQRERWLREQAVVLSATGLHVETQMIWGTPVHECIIENVAALAPDLVLKDIHHEPLLKRVLFTPLDWQLLRLCPAPLLMVSAAAHSLPQRVIAAVDTARQDQAAEDLNDVIVHAALQLAIQCDATLHLAQAFDEVIPAMPAELGATEGFIEACAQLRESNHKSFDAFATRHSVPAEQRHFLSGQAVSVLTGLARKSRTDVLVMGSTTRTGLVRIVMGSTAERILGDLRCDVLVVKPAGFMADLARHFDFGKSGHRAHAQWSAPIELEQP